MPKVFTSEKQKIGKIGESIAEKFLKKKGFLILEKNYTKKWGEIDIVTEKSNKIHFIEVKSVSYLPNKKETREYQPEENMHLWKRKRISRTIQTYLVDKQIPEEKEWQVDLLVVYMDLKNKKARIKTIENIVI